MAKSNKYWCVVRERAWQETLAAAHLTSRGRIMIALAVAALGAVALGFWGSEGAAKDHVIIGGVVLVFYIITVPAIFLCKLIKVPVSIQAEQKKHAEDLQKIVGDNEQRAAIREQLAKFIQEGSNLIDRCTGHDPPTEQEAQEWLDRLNNYVESNLEPSYINRLNDSSGIPRHPFVASNMPQDQIDIEWGITYRLSRLHEFLRELGTIGTR